MKRTLFLFVLVAFLVPNLSQGRTCESKFDQVTVEITVKLGLLSNTTRVNHANNMMERIVEEVPELSFDWDVTGRKSAIIQFTGPRHLAHQYADVYRAFLGI